MFFFVVRANGDWTRHGPGPAEDGQQLRNTLILFDITSIQSTSAITSAAPFDHPQYA